MRYDAASGAYRPVSWEQAFGEIGGELKNLDPKAVVLYTPAAPRSKRATCISCLAACTARTTFQTARTYIIARCKVELGRPKALECAGSIWISERGAMRNERRGEAAFAKKAIWARNPNIVLPLNPDGYVCSVEAARPAKSGLERVPEARRGPRPGFIEYCDSPLRGMTGCAHEHIPASGEESCQAGLAARGRTCGSYCGGTGLGHCIRGDGFGSLGHAVASLGAAGPILYVCLLAIGTIILAPSPVISIAAERPLDGGNPFGASWRDVGSHRLLSTQPLFLAGHAWRLAQRTSDLPRGKDGGR
jgi:hypothetical protein